MEYGSSVLDKIQNKVLRRNLMDSVVRCSTITCTDRIPPVIGAESKNGKIVAGVVRCPQCGKEVRFSGVGSDYDVLFNAVVLWNKGQLNLKQFVPTQRYTW